ncbi:MAG: MATE family efflux transporter [Spirochaetales bacterium]|nr:MATE family efflux transporter [Spirochaetales bacterium]
MLKSFTTYKEFIPKLLTIASPIILQNLLQASLNFVDVFMVGQLGDNAVAGVGIGNYIYFLFIMLIFSIASGASIFTAQYWGKKDIKNIRSTMGIAFTFTGIISLIITIAIILFPRQLIMIYNSDPAVVNLSVQYVEIVVYSFFFTSLSIVYAMILRSTEHVVFPMIVSIIGLSLNTFLNYLLIFGNLGFPKLGVQGAAIATLIAQTLSFTILITFSYVRKHPTAAGFKDMFNYTKKMVKEFMKRWLPVLGQGMGWALGYNMYSIIYGNMGTKSLAAYNIACSVERVCLTLFLGLGGACAIMVGNRIGAGEEEKAKNYSKNFLKLAFIISVVIAFVLIMVRGSIVGIFNLSPETTEYLYNLLLVMACIMLARVMNITFHGGILKAGGDTFFSMIVDMGGIWLIGVPMAAIAAFALGLPVYYVMALAAIEEFVKMIVVYIRFFSNKWINNLTRQAA